MKVTVKTKGRNLSFPVPNGLIFSKASSKVWETVAKVFSQKDGKPDENTHVDQLMGEVSPDAARAIGEEIRRIHGVYGTFTLVQARTSSGDEVLIEL